MIVSRVFLTFWEKQEQMFYFNLIEKQAVSKLCSSTQWDPASRKKIK
jgi:hypothetical protein